MDITLISDIHGYYPKLEGGDLLIVAGDLTASDQKIQYIEFFHWIQDQEYRKIVFISGNHDNWMQKNQSEWRMLTPHQDIIYLCDSGTEFEGLKIWGSPWTKTFAGMNLACKSFTVDTDEELAEKWALIPDDVDILITHTPPYCIFDVVKRGGLYEYTGSVSLRNKVMDIKPRLHCFGHIHEHGGGMIEDGLTKFVNASHVNERYKPVNKPVRIIL